MKNNKNKKKEIKNNCGGRKGGCIITIMPIYIKKEELKKVA